MQESDLQKEFSSYVKEMTELVNSLDEEEKQILALIKNKEKIKNKNDDLAIENARNFRIRCNYRDKENDPHAMEGKVWSRDDEGKIEGLAQWGRGNLLNFNELSGSNYIDVYFKCLKII